MTTIKQSCHHKDSSEDEENINKITPAGSVPVWTSYRYALSYWIFLGAFGIYLLRYNFSVAIVCMTYDAGPNGTNDGTETGEFAWSRQLRGTLLSSFFWGNLVTQMLGGWLAQRYGGCAVSPPLARLSPGGLLAARVVVGCGQGAVLPAVYALAGRWWPPAERATLDAIYATGMAAGSVVSFSLSGVICERLGWPWVFWIFSIFVAVWLVGWCVCVYDTPAKHPRISLQERDYIHQHLGQNSKEQQQQLAPAVPWRRLLTSCPLWGIVVADAASNWASFMSLTQLPQYMKDVLGVDIAQNGLYNALPQLSKVALTLAFAMLSDWVLRRGRVPVTPLRKAMQTVGSVVPLLCAVGVGYVEAAGLALLCLVLMEGFTGAQRPGHCIARMDIAPRFSGVIMGISNTACNVPGIVVPVVVSRLTPHGWRSEWQTCFFISAGAYLVTCLAFVLFGSAEEQDWAKDAQLATPSTDTEHDEEKPLLSTSR